MGNWLIGVLNSIISGLATVIKTILSILPDSPIKAIDNSPVSQYFGFINWIVPVNEMIIELGLFCTAVLVYYGLQIILRWGKAIE